MNCSVVSCAKEGKCTTVKCYLNPFMVGFCAAGLEVAALHPADFEFKAGQCERNCFFHQLLITPNTSPLYQLKERLKALSTWMLAIVLLHYRIALVHSCIVFFQMTLVSFSIFTDGWPGNKSAGCERGFYLSNRGPVC